jgi:hypothetical protein
MPRTFTYTTEVFDEYTDFPITGDVDTIYIDASENKAYRYDQSYYPISSEGVDIWGAIGSLSKGGGGGGGGASWGSINGTLSSQTDLQTALDAKQDDLVSGTNIKTINGSSVLGSGDLTISGSGLKGIHAINPIVSGDQVSSNMQSSGTGSGGPFSANRLVAYPFIPNQSFTSSNLQINVSVLGVGSLCRIAVYTDLNGAPNTSLFISSNLDCSTTGLKTATASINFVAGTTYWLAFHGGTGSSISQIGVNMMYPLKFANINTMANHINKVLSFALPTPTTFGGGNTYAASNMPLILITKA